MFRRALTLVLTSSLLVTLNCNPFASEEDDDTTAMMLLLALALSSSSVLLHCFDRIDHHKLNGNPGRRRLCERCHDFYEFRPSLLDQRQLQMFCGLGERRLLLL